MDAMDAKADSGLDREASHQKPIILCLHGGGTNSTIFKIQTIRVQRHLQNFFDFIFLDAPLESQAGPGVFPVFEECGPFFSWMRTGYHEQPVETKQLLESTLKERYKDIVGVLGFSQGAKLAAGLLLEQQSRQKTDRACGGFKFGVCLMGVSPPLVPSSLSDDERAALVSIPSSHFIGSQDPWRKESRQLFDNHFDKATSRLFEFDVGHRLPTVAEDTLRIVEEIKRLYTETTSRSLVDFKPILI